MSKNPRPLATQYFVVVPIIFTIIACTSLQLPPLPIWLIIANIILTALMAKDKSAAQNASQSGARTYSRTPESTLLLLTLLGATPAMILSQKLFRHKTIKQSFNTSLYAIYIVQVAAIAYFFNQIPALFTTPIK